MTIKELEERTGMTRANIRYYEEEKLLSPRRLPNGYRDYSEEDASTLEKIKLLRQLHLDIDTIRLVQQGQLTLEQALFSQLNRLESDKNTIDRALEVCRRIEQSGVEYGAMDPRFWLAELEKPAFVRLEGDVVPAPVSPREEASEVQKWTWANRACHHPWMRYFARGIDLVIYRMVIDLMGWLLIPNYMLLDPPVLVDWFLTLCLLGFAFLVEPLWLHFWGYTPGKWIFGLKLRDENGEKLTLQQAWERSWRVFWEGYGANIPVFNLVRMWKSRRWSLNSEDCPWDAEEGYLYGREKRRLYGIPFVVVHVVSFAVIFLLISESFLPRHHSDGGLTVEQFCENYNYALQLHNLDDTYPKLTAEGVFEEADAWENVWISNAFGGGRTEWFSPVFQTENGLVTEVSFLMESDTNQNMLWQVNREKIALLAFSGALDVSLRDYDHDGWVEVWDENHVNYWMDYCFDYRGFRVTIDTEAEGYEGMGYSNQLVPFASTERSISRKVTISLIGSED